ncbi:MAG: TrmH family RNA methyltransferase [Lentisphaeria bacterium]|jgi:tRNA G18 (ribose-2'-O)-methylase SpoU|nr:TrmH family RNA methyltransferase [Lentisphaeria bacterium]
MEQAREIHLVLDRLRSAYNVGNIFRIAEAVGAKEVIACGYTAAPPHPKLEKTAMGADKLVPCRTMASSAEAVRTLRNEGVKCIVAAEIVPGKSVFAWDYEYTFPMALVLGNEALGVSPETLELCDGIVELPMAGRKESINVGNAAAAILYAVVAKIRMKEAK